jgi:3-oxoacyl-[acyl-carrier protein] reductase
MMNKSIFTFGKRTAVITGGSKNIGLAIALRFAQAGMQVAIVSSNKDSLSQATQRFEAEGLIASTWQCDISKIHTIDPVLKGISDQHGSIDILVNCAGLLDLSAIEDTTEETWDSILDINLKGTFFMVQKSLPFLKSGTSPRIINIASNAGRMGGYANGMSYTASKGGMISMTYGLARKLAPFSITVNCVAPGTIESDMSRARDAEAQRQLLEKFPLGRIGTADEVATAACYFASIESAFTTGAVLDVNGGLFMG